MINYHKTIVATLNNILPIHYEMTLKSGTPTPCISYMELTNIVAAQGDTQEYSNISYQIKVWSNDLAEIQQYALEIDEAMRSIGFKRIGSAELYDNQSTMIQKIMTYEAFAHEQFN